MVTLKMRTARGVDSTRLKPTPNIAQVAADRKPTMLKIAPYPWNMIMLGAIFSIVGFLSAATWAMFGVGLSLSLIHI